VIVIYNGLNTHGFSAFPPGAHEQVRGELGIPLDAFAVGSVGRLHPQKGYDLLLQAVGFLHTRIPTLRVLIVGEGEARPALEQQRRELGLEEVVIFAGERRDIPAMLSALDGFVSASRWEGLSNAVLEAAAAGLPVIATRVGGTPEIVLDGETGLLVEPEDAQGLATAILQLYENPELRRRLGQAGQQRVEAAFTLRTTIQKTGQLYTRLLAKRRLGG
jgi:glycosyltransferase involved in cell wall biosynthesis